MPEGFPSAQRIQEDIDRVVDEAYLRIFHAQGIVVPGLGTRRGRRYERSNVQRPRGGKTEKNKKFQKKWVHPDARKAYEERLQIVSKLYSQSITNR